MTTAVTKHAHYLFDWMNERHRVWHRRYVEGKAWPWTLDDVLQQYAFCNVFRELDRVTIWIRESWREPFAQHPNLWFAMCVARLINWPDTLLRIGFPRAEDNDDMRDWMRKAVNVIHGMQSEGLKAYTGAYMLRADSPDKEGKFIADKATYTMYKVLWPIWLRRVEFYENLETEPTLYATWKWLVQFYGMGGFFAYEVVTDLRWTRYLENASDKMTWANAGPGAIRGLQRLINGDNGATLEGKKPLSQAMANYLMKELCVQSNIIGMERGIDPLLYEWREPGTYTPIEMRDIEHSLCEMDKYLRAVQGTGRPRAKYHPPKSAVRRS